jgi:hypothetical protein
LFLYIYRKRQDEMASLGTLSSPFLHPDLYLPCNWKGGFVRKTLMLTLVVVSFAVCSFAQDAGKTADMTTIQGCLQYTRHHYVLTDSSGKEHQLSGYANKLKAHVGHEIEVTGTEGTQSHSTTMQGAASSTHEVPVFKVSSLKHIADTCKAAGK